MVFSLLLHILRVVFVFTARVVLHECILKGCWPGVVGVVHGLFCLFYITIVTASISVSLASYNNRRPANPRGPGSSVRAPPASAIPALPPSRNSSRGRPHVARTRGTNTVGVSRPCRFRC